MHDIAILCLLRLEIKSDCRKIDAISCLESGSTNPVCMVRHLQSDKGSYLRIPYTWFEIVLNEAQNNTIRSPGYVITSQIMCIACAIIYTLNSQLMLRKVTVKWSGNFPCIEQFVRKELAS